MAPSDRAKTARGTASILSPLFGLLHPALQHRLDLLCALWCDVQFLEPGILGWILMGLDRCSLGLSA